MKKKIRIGILFGGRSAEHEVSIVTARNVMDAIDKNTYEVFLIGIDKNGVWSLPSPRQLRIASKSVETAMLPAIASFVTVAPYSHKNQLITSDFSKNGNIDVVFPLVHGPYGEDGTVQGLLKLMNVPFVGASVLGSAAGMDKDVSKRLLRDSGIPVVKFIAAMDNEKRNFPFENIQSELGLPFFVKPANAGSSIGVSKVYNRKDYNTAVEIAFTYDNKILFEEGIDAREIECSVLGNEEKISSVPGEIIPTHEFYDYEAKYIDENGASLEIPAKLSQSTINKIRQLAIKACTVLSIDGMARVDFFIHRKTQKIYLNEVNTIPGFTNISMYPKLWEYTGIGYTELIDRLIKLAIQRHEKEKKLKTSRD